MRNHLKEFLEKHNTVAYELQTDVRKSIEDLEFVYIKLTCVYNDYMTLHYYTDSDNLQIWDEIDKSVYIYNDFSKLSDEAYHFQQMTVLDHIGFEHDEVQPMMDIINRIKRKHETKSTKRTRSKTN
ncbi:hypothetical protein FDG95_gp592 [Pectobacterium phage vB_PcaM_CBB]|uniref:Uncharacterized protein n=1 Tax=Pectobacterium phage vB_PcaM_CBB TaxID=2772511 RepID=A0A1L2CV88_9CAUD|nr:hypothetical protein FDG95_gp592 [Pectobacterium phage vB_PcaM_CBB]AMM43950.1 hypothetical protein CBB_387 [Pectobacterium phage vB_PcaM_CBB]